MLRVGHFAQRCTTIGQHFTHLTGSQTQGGVLALACNKLHRGPGGTRNLRAFARLQFNAVNHGTARYIAQRQTVARLDRRRRTRLQNLASLYTLWRYDIATLTIGEQQQRDVCGAVGVILKALHLGGNRILVTLEINNAIVLLVATANVTRGDAPIVVTTTIPAISLLLLNPPRQSRCHDPAPVSRMLSSRSISC